MNEIRKYLALRDGVPVDERFKTLKAAVAYYEALNLRLVTLTPDCAEFHARKVETQAETRDGRTFHEVFTAHVSRVVKTALVEKAKKGAAARKRNRATHCKQPGCTAPREAGSHQVLCEYHRKERDAKRRKEWYAAQKQEAV